MFNYIPIARRSSDSTRLVHVAFPKKLNIQQLKHTLPPVVQTLNFMSIYCQVILYIIMIIVPTYICYQVSSETNSSHSNRNIINKHVRQVNDRIIATSAHALPYK